ncbi:hypothetical protein TRIUR3_00743 [Triticum urartu]|uniref:Uncharacterized protein n=1 Tax=Triticum urartu TaxID=4572 RepID=M7YK82_TRIUA|nr:hypothetical protein TRIUR3_00743 [Triticum urartu]
MQIRASAINDLQRSKSSLEALFCYDKAVPEENIGKPAGLDLEKKEVGKNPPCVRCETKGAVLCATCAGSGLYVDSIMESQGIIVKVRCLDKALYATVKQEQQTHITYLLSCSIKQKLCANMGTLPLSRMNDRNSTRFTN